MRHIKSIMTLLMICGILSIFNACSSKTPEPQATTLPSEELNTPDANEEQIEVDVIDMLGRSLHLHAPMKRIVALDAASCEIVFALGEGDAIVGRGEYCNYPEEALNITSVQSGQEVNIEQILALEPDLVIMSMMAQTEEQISSLETAGVPVLATDAQNIQEVYESIELIGTALGRADKADALVADMKAGFDEIIRKVGESTSVKSVYFEVSPLEWGLWASGKDTFMDEISTMLGLKNVFEDLDGWAEVSEEQVLDRNPDYIVTIMMYFGEGPLPVDEIKSRAGWQNVNAVKNDNVFHADSDEISRPGPRLVNAAQVLYELIYEEE